MEKAMGKKLLMIVSVAAIVIISSAVTAGAGNLNRKLYGDYSANFMLSCGSCNLEFTTYKPADGIFPTGPACLPISIDDVASSSTHTWNAQGVYTFDGEGTVEFLGKYLVVLPDPMDGFKPVILPQKLFCDGGIYTVNDDLTFKAGFESCKVYFDSAGIYLVHDIKNVNLRGQILDRMDGAILLITDSLDPKLPYPAANIETVINYDPRTGKETAPSYRICGMTGTAIPIKGLRMKRGE